MLDQSLSPAFGNDHLWSDLNYNSLMCKNQSTESKMTKPMLMRIKLRFILLQPELTYAGKMGFPQCLQNKKKCMWFWNFSASKAPKVNWSKDFRNINESKDHVWWIASSDSLISPNSFLQLKYPSLYDARLNFLRKM